MITGKTSLVGIMGDPVEHSLSPPMHNAAFGQLKLDYVYVPFHVKRGNLSPAMEGARNMGIKGLNLTIPHKIEVIKYLDELEGVAELIGAVNTVKFTENHVVGYNTDGFGAVKAIEEKKPIKGKKIIILGAGGAARAISFQLILNGVGEVLIANRTQEKACNLKDELTETSNTSVDCLELGDELSLELEDADVLINTTPVGMYPHHNDEPVVKADRMHADLLVNDIVYNPLETGLLREASKAGAQVVHGTKMLIYQGVEAFRIWTGVTPPVAVFETVLMRELGY
ncbi:MAG: shikimate dehydrogenase [Methanobacterium sp.]|uniref:shikimate dehydrogenase n=1 Tax=Methanobacterium sp. TaxID=2164 RepID=UPI00258A2931|nr:shikimate dehydrogenase [Methanobacterium sp.]MCC7560360.1 shikimate dehydrogenase [Methanobacterium sp.]